MKNTHGGARPNAGRKPGKTITHRLSVGLTEANYAKLKATSEQTGKPMSSIVNELVSVHLTTFV